MVSLGFFSNWILRRPMIISCQLRVLIIFVEEVQFRGEMTFLNKVLYFYGAFLYFGEW
jgi:hypothetical protein